MVGIVLTGGQRTGLDNPRGFTVAQRLGQQRANQAAAKTRSRMKNDLAIRAITDGPRMDEMGKWYDQKGKRISNPKQAPGLVLSDGSSYTGEFRDGEFHGQGVLVTSSGRRYEGGFKDGIFHGHGVFDFPSNMSCEGEWHDGKFIGEGTGWAEGLRQKCRRDGNTFVFYE